MPASFKLERLLWDKGYKLIAGVDEAGRGPLAGPIFAAAVIFPQGIKFSGLDDSKKLTPKKRESLYIEIKRKALAIGVAFLDHAYIDKAGISPANQRVLKMAVKNLILRPDYLLIDGKSLGINLNISQKLLPKGDAQSASIAAASIVAKVSRDRIMRDYHKQFPHYRFDLHKGYGTKLHLANLAAWGPCPIHRQTFFPVSKFLESRIALDIRLS